MEKLVKVEGIVAAIDRVDVDTDQIIPKQFLKRVERTGYGQFLFNDWRYLNGDVTKPNPDFELNKPAVKGAKIIVSGRNFGCGSSREHAAWALHDFGIRAVIAPSYADIFLSNCFQTGIVPVLLEESEVKALIDRALKGGYHATVDVETLEVRGEDGFKASFQLDPFRRHCLMNGLDDIGLTLQHEPDISRYERERAIPASWVA
jgi:3-isopropylmalate/(R)-2-methylmalate dehydratase small subunit